MGVLVIKVREQKMEDVLHEPVELSDQDLNKVAGGNPFNTVFGDISFNSFAIGAVSGDFSSFAFSTNAGQVNTFGTNVA
jgi:hypothetical protein